MRCTHCSADNPLIAHYCGVCGHPFTEEERQSAYDQTIYGKVDKARKIKDYITLDFIKGSRWFKVLTLLAILALGIWLRLSGVNALRLESGDGYRIEYLEETDTYYLISEQEAVDLRLVVPGGTSELTVEELDGDGNPIASRSVSVDDGVSLAVSGESCYELQSYRDDRLTGSLTVYVFRDGTKEAP